MISWPKLSLSIYQMYSLLTQSDVPEEYAKTKTGKSLQMRTIITYFMLLEIQYINILFKNSPCPFYNFILQWRQFQILKLSWRMNSPLTSLLAVIWSFLIFSSVVHTANTAGSIQCGVRSTESKPVPVFLPWTNNYHALRSPQLCNVRVPWKYKVTDSTLRTHFCRLETVLPTQLHAKRMVSRWNFQMY